MTFKINLKLLVIYVMSTIILSFVVESIHRSSIIDTFTYTIEMPMRMLVNIGIIAITTSMIFFVKRKGFTFTVISIIWLLLSITSRVLLTLRGNPFTISDAVMIREGLEVSSKYISWQQGVGIGLVILIILCVIIYLWRRDKGTNHKGRGTIFLIWLITFTIGFFGFDQFQNKSIMAADSPDLSRMFNNNGFVFSFVDTTAHYFKSKKPEHYTKANVMALKKSIHVEHQSEISKKPNIIMIQLESFFDPTWLKNVTYTEDPIPTFRQISQKYSSGQLTVPTVGAGTVRTEFEVLTGLTMKFLTPWEIPNNTILKQTPVESIVRTVSAQGYSTHAIHNNEGVFYDRNQVYRNIGFDTFTSIEYMNNYEKTPNGWVKDSVLTGEIQKALNSTKGSDLIYGVTVQGHGGYPTEDMLPTKHLSVIGNIKDGDKNSLEYYVNQLYETDLFIKNLLRMIEKKKEPTVVVMFGDHLPKLPEVEVENLTTNSRFIVPYVIWDNMKLPKKNKDISAYTLSTEVLNKVNLQGGIINRFQNMYAGKKDYFKKYELLQYDLLYGDKYIYANAVKPVASKMVMGVSEIAISHVYQQGEDTLIEGDNFTPSSEVIINDSQKNTVFMSDKQLLVKGYKLENNEQIEIRQVGRKTLSVSKPYKLDGKNASALNR